MSSSRKIKLYIEKNWKNPSQEVIFIYWMRFLDWYFKLDEINRKIGDHFICKKYNSVDDWIAYTTDCLHKKNSHDNLKSIIYNIVFIKFIIKNKQNF